MIGASVPSWRRILRATATPLVCVALALGACVHDRRAVHDLVRVAAATTSPSPTAASTGPADTPSVASFRANDSVRSSDEPQDSRPSPAPGAPEAPATWGLPNDSSAPPPPSSAPAIAGDVELLPVAGQPSAWLSLPTGATSRRPVLIVIHGAGDRPERQCRGWRRTTNEYPFIICPTGRAWPRYTHIGGAPLLAYIDEALDALAARYPDYVDANTPLLAGFSLGAAQATELATKFPSRFPRVALVEGATKVWSSGRGLTFVQGGGQRVLFGCGQDGVRNRAERTAKQLESVGLDTHVVFANVGHKFAPPLEDAVRGELAWLMAGDERWSATP